MARLLMPLFSLTAAAAELSLARSSSSSSNAKFSVNATAQAAATSSSSSTTPTFLQHLVHQQATFLQVKQELQDDLQEATHQAHQASINATDDSHLCVVCMDEERGVLYVPCNHLAVCVGCEEGLAAASMACPMCQEPIDRSRSISGIVVS